MRYFNAAPDQAWAVNQAVGAWNGSCADVRFVRVPRAQAQLVITDPPDKVYCSEGLATVGYVPGAEVVPLPGTRPHARLQPVLGGARDGARARPRARAPGHEDHYCAAMNATGSMRGGKECEPKLPWAWRCRLLEPDDIAGVAAIYGGHPRPVRPQPLCDLYGPMQAPRDASATHTTGSSAVALTFARPPEPSIPAFAMPSPWQPRDSFVISAPARTCPSLDPLSDAVFHVPHWRWHAKPGQMETFETPAVRGRSCYAIWATDRLGRPSAVAHVYVTVH